MKLENVPTVDLVNEIRRRCVCSIVGLVIKDGHPEANVRVFMHLEKNEDTLKLLGLSELCHSDVMAAAREQMGLTPGGGAG